jgi:peptidoglycan L-alanyl-D-glutamate endopeptidase CwlK
MKNHGKFTEETYALLRKNLGDQAFANRLAMEIVVLSRMGLAPEGMGSPAVNELVDYLYRNPKLFRDEALPAPAMAPIPMPPKPKYSLSTESLAKMTSLVGRLHPKLAETVRLAITLTTQDFKVLEVYRTEARQRRLVESGASRTMKSKHLLQPDGFVHAVDLGAWNDGKVTWGFEDYLEIVQAMDAAATQLGYANHIRWGGIWDMVLADYGGVTPALYKKAIEEYKIRHAGPDFLDGPHFEWVA